MAEAPPPYHDWMVVEDTSQLPPPPGYPYQHSPPSSASYQDAERAHDWTNRNPLWPALQLNDSQKAALSIGFATLIRSREFIGSIARVGDKPGQWRIESNTNTASPDCCLLSNVPLYSPQHGTQGVITYFELEIIHFKSRDDAISIGFVAPPYPTWRQPGWERASIGVFSDDGNRYINDSNNGQQFVEPWKAGETVGIGMRWDNHLLEESKKHDGFPKKEAKIFFTRNGVEENSWSLHEPVDASLEQPGGVNGLEGDRDLYAAIGFFGRVEAIVKFGRHNWKYHP